MCASRPGLSAHSTWIATSCCALLVAVPLDVDAALGIEVEALVAIAAVHGDAAAARDEADDRIARQRRAALREPHEDVLLAGDLDAASTTCARVTLRSSVFSMLSAFGAARSSAFFASSGSAFSRTCCAVILP